MLNETFVKELIQDVNPRLADRLRNREMEEYVRLCVKGLRDEYRTLGGGKGDLQKELYATEVAIAHLREKVEAEGKPQMPGDQWEEAQMRAFLSSVIRT